MRLFYLIFDFLLKRYHAIFSMLQYCSNRTILHWLELVTTDKRRNQLVSEPNYHKAKWFSENLLAIEMKKTKVKMNKPIYLGLAVLDISKTLLV